MKVYRLLILLLLTALPAFGEENPGIFEVAKYGAKGDGIADDTAAVQKAIAEASGSGGVVQFGKGKYRITGSLKVEANNVVIRGLGRGISTVWADGTGFHALTVGRDDLEVQGITVSNLDISRPKPADPGIANIFILRTRYSSLEDMRIDNGGDGIAVGSVRATDITGCVSINRIWMGGCRRCLVVANAADVIINQMYAGFTETGVYFTHGANNIRLTDSLFLTMRPTQGKHGLASDSGFMQEVKGCVFEETSEEVVKVTGVLRFYFHDNWINANPDFPLVKLERTAWFGIRNTRYGGSGTGCVELDRCSRGDVTGNSMESSRGIGIKIIGGDNLEVNDNQMNGNDLEGIRLEGNPVGIRITGNHILAGDAAIHLTESVGDNLIIKDNFLSKGKRGALLDESKAKTKIIEGNIEETSQHSNR